MTKREKLISKIESRPIRKDITVHELASYLELFGFKYVKNSTSHRVYSHPMFQGRMVLPCHSEGDTVLSVYVKQAVSLIQQFKETGGSNNGKL